MHPGAANFGSSVSMGGAASEYLPAAVEEMQRREQRDILKKVVWANMAIDALDMAVLGWAVSRGVVARGAFGMIGGAALGMFTLGAVCIRKL